MKKTIPILMVALLGLTGGGSYWIGQRQAAAPVTLDGLAPQTGAAASKHAYVCPMHPHIVQGQPGTCPLCGMDLTALKETQAVGASQVHVDAATRQKLGVRLARAELGTLTHDIATYGTLVSDEGAVQRIMPQVEGVLTRLHVSRAGQAVARGALLYELSSQEALNLQYEYIDILRRSIPAAQMAEARREQNRIAIEKAGAQDEPAREQAERGARQSEEQLQSILQPMKRDRERIGLSLRQIGFSDAMLERIATSGEALTQIPVHARQACVVQAVSAQPGMRIGAMSEILRCVDPSRVQIEVVLYPDQIGWVAEGDAVTAEFGEGGTIHIRLRGLHPLLDETGRTLRVRIPVAPEHAGLLGAYARVTLHTTSRRVLSIPKSALMRSGRGDYVMRALDRGHFLPVKVLTGIETGERVAIRDGLEAGDQVAVNGHFLIDAAASLADAAQRMRSGSSPAP